MLVGTDINIASVIDTFNLKLWNTLSNNGFYGQVYRNVKSGNIIPEIYKEDGKNYQEVIFDDRKDAICFFDVEENIENLDADNQPTRECKIIFAVNLSKTHPLITYRAEENAHLDVLSILRKYHSLDVTVNSITSGRNAFGDLYTDNLKSYNMHPYHTFALNCTIKINYQNC